MKTQNQKIKRHLLSGKSLNPLQALSKFGCFRLASRINDLRNEGLFINTTIVHKNKKRFAEYKIK